MFITQGALAERPFYKILRDLIRDKATGVLTVQGESDTIVCTFEMGLCVRAESHYPDESIRIGQLMMKRGFISENQLTEILEKQTQTLRKFGFIARKEGYIELPDLMDIIEDQILLILFPCFCWRTGFFYFRNEDTVPYDQESSRPIDLDPIVEIGPKILKNWDWLKERLPDWDLIPQLVPDVVVVPQSADPEHGEIAGNAPVVLTPGQEKVYNLCNSVFSIREIVNACHQFPYFSFEALLDLEDMGVIRIPQQEKARSRLVENLEDVFHQISHNIRFVFIPVGVLALGALLYLLPVKSISGISYKKNSQCMEVRTRFKMDRIHFALEGYCFQAGKYPDFLDELIETNIISSKDISDAWGAKFFYRKSEDGFELISEGEDGEWATADDLKITYRQPCCSEINFFPAPFNPGGQDVSHGK